MPLMGPFITTNSLPLESGAQASPVGVGLGGPEDINNQLNALVAQWNTARILSKPAAVRAMIMMRQKGQGGTFDTEALALEARLKAASFLEPGSYDELIDVYHAGFNAFETLMLRSLNPFGGVNTPPPNLAALPLPAVDLGITAAQPFSEWIAELSPAGDNGIGSKWHPNSDDKRTIGDTWGPAIAKRTSSPGVYKKMRYLPGGYIQDRWVRIS